MVPVIFTYSADRGERERGTEMNVVLVFKGTLSIFKIFLQTVTNTGNSSLIYGK